MTQKMANLEDALYTFESLSVASLTVRIIGATFGSSYGEILT